MCVFKEGNDGMIACGELLQIGWLEMDEDASLFIGIVCFIHIFSIDLDPFEELIGLFIIKVALEPEVTGLCASFCQIALVPSTIRYLGAGGVM